MSQSEINAEIDQYLHLVRKKLSMLPDAEDIVQELRTHIWESANKYASRDGLPIEQAFRKALDNMEDPEVLANRFYEESGYEYTSSSTTPSYPSSSSSSFSQSFQQKSVVPEKKLDQDKFLYIAILGFISTVIIGGTLVAVINDPIVSILGSLIQVAAFAIFIGYLYYRDDQTFREQVMLFRQKFEKEFNKNKTKTKNKNKFTIPPALDAFFVHLGALIAAVFMFLVILFLTYISYINVQPFFNDYWYSIGFIGFVIMIGSEMVYYVIKAFLGQVRGLRMVESLFNFTSALITFVLIFYYPFTIGHGILALSGSSITDPKVISFLSTQLDYYIRIFMGIAVVVNLMKGIYGIFKFETWKAKDTKSLLNV